MRTSISSRLFRQAALSAVLILLTAQSSFGQQRKLAATLAAAPATEPSVAAMPESQLVGFSLTLPLRNQEQLQALLAALSDPKSPQYQHYLTSQEFSEQFGPTADDYAKVLSYATAQGFEVTRTFSNRLMVNVRASAASINRAFNVKMQMHQHPTENRRYYAPDVNPTVDASLPILSVEGLSNRDLPHPMLKLSASNVVHADTTGSGANGTFLGSDMRAAYAPGIALAGEGETIGLIEFGPYNMSDVQMYFNTIGQPLKVPIYNVLLNVDGVCAGTPASGGCDDGEEVIDIEQAISMAPSLSGLIVYESSGSDLLTPFTQAASDDTARQLSLSFGLGGGTPTTQPGFEQVFMELQAQGQNLFVASGDAGATVGDVGYPGNSPNITDVGGTDLTTAGAGGPWQSETAWVGSGGGWNTQSPIPSYQKPVITNANQGNATLRNIPDVAMEANNDNFFCANGSCQEGIGGTSLAAPRWAGFLALANEQANGNPIGFLNPIVYSLGQSSAYNIAFHDITQGNNFNSSSPNLFQAVTGYDLTTGWGAPNGQGMLNALTSAVNPSAPNFTLTASSATLDLTPGSSSTSTVTLSPVNGFNSTVNLNVTAVGAPSGVTATVTPTTLTGAGNATINVTTGNTTPAGNLALAITGSSNGITHTVYIQLALPDVALTASPSTIYLNQGSTANSTISINAENGFNGSLNLSATDLPSGVTAVFSPESATTSSTLTLAASSTAPTTSGASVIVGGTLSGSRRIAPSFAVAVNAAIGTSGAGTPVNLSSAYNLTGITTDGTTFTNGGLDGEGFAYSANLLAAGRMLNGVQFNFGSPNVANSVFASGQTISLPTGQFTSLQLLGTGINGDQTAQNFQVTYTDGSTTIVSQSLSDWFTPSNNRGEQEAVAMPYRDAASGAKDNRQFNLYAYVFLLDSTKTVKSLTLPSNRNVILLAATLTSQSVGTPVDVTNSFNLNGIYTDGTVYSTTGLDGAGSAYSANLLGNAGGPTNLVIGNADFHLAAPNVPDALFGTTTPLPLPAGNFDTLQLLGTAVQGAQNIQPITVNYTDGTNDVILQNFSDWSQFSNNPNESVALQMPYRDFQNGTRQNQTFNLYRYQLPINPSKTTSSVLLARNSNVVALAMTLTRNQATSINPSLSYNVVNQNSGSCVDDQNFGTTNGSIVQQFTCGTGQSNQEWQFTPTDSGYYKVTSREAPLVWDVTGGPGATQTGVKIQLFTFGGGTNQQWLPVSLGNGTYNFVARNSGLCLDVPGASTANGVQLQQFTCNGTAAQAFVLKQVINPSAWYNVVNQNSGSCVDDQNFGTTNGSIVQQFACGNAQSNQEWQFTPTDSGYYEVTSREAPLVWDVTGGSAATQTGVKIELFTFHDGTNQQWLPVFVGNGTYNFIARHSGLCLDVPGASTANGVQLQQFTCNGTAAQAFVLKQQP